MRFKIIIILFIFMKLSPFLCAEKWKLVWNDEFDDNDIDPAKWYIEDAALVKNNEEQYYSPENVKEDNEFLIIKSENKSTGNRPYTSGLVETKGLFNFQYGKVEVRAKIPKGQGIWPAIWLLNSKGIWPPEIDIMESVGHEPEVIHMTHHFRVDGNHRSDGNSFRADDFSKDFHIYTVCWNPKEIVWFIDGIKRYRSTKNIPHIPFYIIINTAVGGDWPGSPDSTTIFPQYHYVDYVRVYKDTESNYVSLDTYAENGCITTDKDSYVYKKGSAVTLKASPSINYEFSHWSGDINSFVNPISLVLKNNTKVQAVFKRKKDILKIISQDSLLNSSSDESPGLNASKACDGKLDTRWSSEFADPQWLQIDLKKPKRLEALKIVWEKAYARKFTVSVSLNGSKWAEIIKEDNNYNQINEYYTDPMPVRFIKIKGLKRATEWGYSLWEVEVYGREIG